MLCAYPSLPVYVIFVALLLSSLALWWFALFFMLLSLLYSLYIGLFYVSVVCCICAPFDCRSLRYAVVSHACAMLCLRGVASCVCAMLYAVAHELACYSAR